MSSLLFDICSARSSTSFRIFDFELSGFFKLAQQLNFLSQNNPFLSSCLVTRLKTSKNCRLLLKSFFDQKIRRFNEDNEETADLNPCVTVHPFNFSVFAQKTGLPSFSFVDWPQDSCQPLSESAVRSRNDSVISREAFQHFPSRNNWLIRKFDF